MDYKNYIYPIYVHLMDNNNESRQSFVGNGFVINNFFITASHVILDNQEQTDQSNPYFILEGKEYELVKSKSFFWKSMSYDQNGNPIGHANIENGDFAAYEIPGIKSPLSLAENPPNYEEAFHCCFFHNMEPRNSKYHTTDTKPIYYWETKGIVFGSSGFMGNFFGAKMHPEHPMGGGSSGSPLLRDNIVYGVLHAGNPYDRTENKHHPEICIFYAASAAFQCLI